MDGLHSSIKIISQDTTYYLSHTIRILWHSTNEGISSKLFRMTKRRLWKNLMTRFRSHGRIYGARPIFMERILESCMVGRNRGMWVVIDLWHRFLRDEHVWIGAVFYGEKCKLVCILKNWRLLQFALQCFYAHFRLDFITHWLAHLIACSPIWWLARLFP